MKELKDLYIQICACRDCHLPLGYCSQLRPYGPEYKAGGVVFVQINPGHIGSLSTEEIEQKYVSQNDRNIAIRKATDTRKLLSLQRQFTENPSDTTYDRMSNTFLRSMSELWGWPPGKYGSTITAHGVLLETIAVLNLAQCPVPDDLYGRRQLELCWTKWTSRMLMLLQPSMIVAQGKQVWEFLRNRQLPLNVKLVAGLHHADRRNKQVKERVLSCVREITRQRA